MSAAQHLSNEGTVLAVGPNAAARDDARRRWLPQSLSTGSAGLAIAHAMLAGRQQADEWLARAVAGGVTVGDGSGLWFGAPAVAFAAAVTDPVRYRTALDCLDTAIARLVRARLDAATARLADASRPALAEFDLVHGLTGLGAYLLTRDPDGRLLREVLAYLVRLTEPVLADDECGTGVPGWWTADAPSAGSPLQGHGNLGMAHGVAGPLALLALTQRRGITVAGQSTAIDRITGWIGSWQQEGPDGPWWPKYVSVHEVRAGRLTQQGPGRPSWCYGTPGISRALQLAAIARSDQARQAAAERALTRCVTDPRQLAALTDPYVCHGWAGLAATVWAATADACTSDLPTTMPQIIRQLHAAVDTDNGQTTGLINGNPGAAAVLHTITAGSEASWTRCLLLT
ncbi:lanthionine synthetase C family protein [Catenuloplanes japonicus]|uniref:lanthionine synthetase C family protein n=1 Tax=Catenuloplanes japonicus TaxID=33876 RepID=UPI00068EEC5A|nr:lanthionine synthetase C family protein [Catenuloplanes japonicus]